MSWISNIIEKLNPAQPDIYSEEGEQKPTTTSKYNVVKAYEGLEVVNRLIVLFLK